MTTAAPSFELIRRARIESLNLNFEEYTHAATGARHFHLDAEDDNNAFLIAFLTVPRDSTGVAHILEHTSLCGSRRFPVRDPFFLMIRRSLNTFMNALTASDWTAYPFATRNRKDFDNLLQVYLDATFFPNLDRMDFAQEGHRIERATPGDPASELVRKGVVFNEMKGAMSPPVAQVGQRLQSLLFPTITYHHNSGGDPEDIPGLTWEMLRAFHDRQYHPSNAVLMTYGDVPAAERQEAFERHALRQFERREIEVAIPDEKRYGEPRREFDHYAANEPETAARTHHLMGWLLGRAGDPHEAMRTRLLAGVLLEHGGSPLRHALETTSLGTAPSELSGYDNDTREATFACGIEGSEIEHADAFEELVLSVLDDLARNGVAREEIDSVLHQIELGQREISGGRFPYGLLLQLRSLGPILHGADGLSVLDIDPVLESLREEAADPDFIRRLVRSSLIDNPHRVRLTMSPDPELPARRAEREREQLEQVRAAMSEEELAAVDEAAAELKRRQEAAEDPSILPKVGIEDVPDDITIPEGEQRAFGPAPGFWFPAGTNGLSYLQAIMALPALDAEQIALMPIFCDCLTEVGSGGRDYLATQARQAAVTGGIRAGLSVGSNLKDLNRLEGWFVLSGKALARNQGALAELLAETLATARFDELDRIRELVAQGRAQVESHLTRSGHMIAMSTASAGLGRYATLDNLWSGTEGIRRLKALDDALNGEDALKDFAKRLEALRDALLGAPVELLVVGEGEQADASAAAAEALASALTRDGSDAERASFDPGNAVEGNAPAAPAREAWLTTTEVNFCARAFPAVPLGHADAPALRVLGPYLRNTILHRAIREQGGAYGAGANYGADSGTFRFFSYRDPRIGGTFDDFDLARRNLLEEPQDAAHLEEAILGVISDLDRPGSPAGEAIGSHFGTRHGRDPAQRRRFRQAVLEVTLDDLKAVTERWLTPERMRDVVVTSEELLEKEPDQFEAHRL